MLPFLQIKLKSLQMFTSVVQHRDRENATPFIRGVAPKILEYLLMLQDDKTNVDSNIGLILASINLAELLVAKAEDDKRKYLYDPSHFNHANLS